MVALQGDPSQARDDSGTRMTAVLEMMKNEDINNMPTEQQSPFDFEKSLAELTQLVEEMENRG